MEHLLVTHQGLARVIYPFFIPKRAWRGAKTHMQAIWVCVAVNAMIFRELSLG